MVYPALLPLMRTPRLPVVDWTDPSPPTHANLNGLVRFAERPNLVSARVPSHFKRALPDAVDTVICAPDDGWRDHPKYVGQFTDKVKCMVVSCWTFNDIKGRGRTIRNGVVLYKQLILLTMDYACPVWRSAVQTPIRKPQVFQLKCLRIATNAPWYTGNRKIHKDFEVLFFPNDIINLIQASTSQMSAVGGNSAVTDRWPKDDPGRRYSAGKSKPPGKL